MSRADRFTQENKKFDYYTDFSINMDKHPLTGDIAIIKNENAIKSSLKNCILVDLGEVPYEMNFGSKVKGSLFENINGQTASLIKESIRNSIENNENRVYIDTNPDAIQVVPSPDLNAYLVSIEFKMINSTETQTLQFILERVR